MKNLLTLIKDGKRKPKVCDINKRKILAFIRLLKDLLGWPCFHLITIDLIVDLVIAETI